MLRGSEPAGPQLQRRFPFCLVGRSPVMRCPRNLYRAPAWLCARRRARSEGSLWRRAARRPPACVWRPRPGSARGDERAWRGRAAESGRRRLLAQARPARCAAVAVGLASASARRGPAGLTRRLRGRRQARPRQQRSLSCEQRRGRPAALPGRPSRPRGAAPPAFGGQRSPRVASNEMTNSRPRNRLFLWKLRKLSSVIQRTPRQ